MRDPAAKVLIGVDQVYRSLRNVLNDDHPLKSDSIQRWVDFGLLMPFKWNGTNQLVSPKISFVSSPEEWCDAQLMDAALLTLDLLEEANGAGVDLKDASAWNIIFEGCKPIFCDLTSLESIQSHAWWPAGQFVRHFIGPLWLAKVTGLQSRDLFRMNRDGASPELVRETLGWRRFLNRCWPLVAHVKDYSNSKQFTGPTTAQTTRYRKNLIESLRWMLNGVQPKSLRNTIWGQYTHSRGHYTQQDLDLKRDIVSQWLAQLKPAWTLDLGCNSGEFSQLALDFGSRVIALDGDHDAVQAMYIQHKSSFRLYPILSSLDDIHSGRGWAGIEHSGLAQRLTSCADVVLMLALVHHLSIASSIHLEEVASFAAMCTRNWLVVELIEHTDSQIQQLCSQRRRDPSEFSVDIQRRAFIDAGFVLRQEVSLTQGFRHLALFEKTS